MEITLTLTAEEAEEVTLRHAQALTAGQTSAQTPQEYMRGALTDAVGSWREETLRRRLADLAAKVRRIPVEKLEEFEATVEAELTKRG